MTKSDTPKAFDVFRPGKTQASPTSRPVIVGHKPAVQDTTLTDTSSTIVGVPEHRDIMDSSDKVEVVAPKPEANTESAKDTETPATLTDNPSTNDKKEQVPDKAAEAKTEAGELAMSHDAVVAFHKPASGRQSLKVIGIVVVFVILVAALFDALLDAGTVKPVFNIPHTHFFKQN